MGALVGVEPHLVALLDSPGVVEFADVRQRDVDAVASQSVDVHLGELEDGFGTDVGGPYGSIGEEEALFGREAVHLVLVDLAFLDGVLHSEVADVEAAVVGDVLAEGECAVGVGFGIVEDLDGVECVDEYLSVLLEVGGILLGPPVVEVAVLVVVAALVVETVGEFVSDDHSDGAVVGGIVSVELEERRLEDSCGEADFVGGGVVVGVDGLRRHLPFVAIDGLVDFAHIVGHIELVAADDVGVVAVVLDFEAAIVAPFVGIADLDEDGGEFFVCVSLGLVAHPGGHIDALTEGGHQVVDEGFHTFFGFCGEVFVDIEVTEGFAHSAVDGGGDAFPAGAVDFATAEELAVEVEAGVDEVVAEVGSCAVDFVPSEVGLEVVDVLFGEDVADGGKVLRLSDIEGLHTVEDAHSGEVAFPVDVAGQCDSLVDGLAVEGLEGVAVGELVVLRFGELGFESHNGGGELVGANAGELVVASIGELGGHQLEVAVADGGVVALVGEVVVAVAEAESALVGPGDALLGVVLVGFAEDGEEDVVAAFVHLDDFGVDVVAGLEGVDFIEEGFEGFGALLLQADAVHTDVVEGSDLVGDAAGLVLVGRDGVDDAFELFLVFLGEEVEGAVARVFGVEGVVFEPSAAGVLVEVVERRDGGVEVVEVDAGGEFGFFVTTCSDHCHCCDC